MLPPGGSIDSSTYNLILNLFIQILYFLEWMAARLRKNNDIGGIDYICLTDATPIKSLLFFDPVLFFNKLKKKGTVKKKEEEEPEMISKNVLMKKQFFNSE